MKPRILHSASAGLPTLAALLAGGWLLTGSVPARGEENTFLNHLTFSARVGLNMDVKFKPRVRYTPDGDRYNYLDGYALDNDADNFNPFGGDPITQYVGWDNWANQVNPTVNPAPLLLTRTDPDLVSHTLNDDPQWGGELAYKRSLLTRGEARVGFELAANFLNLCLKDRHTKSGPGTRDIYYWEQTTNPNTFDYLTSHQGPRSLPPDDPPPFFYRNASNSTPATLDVANNDRFEADVWGFRLGPYLHCPLGRKLDLHLIGGLAVAVVDANWSWAQSFAVNGQGYPTRTGRGEDTDVLWGWYVGGNLNWQFSERWSAVAGVQYQDVGTYRSDVGDRRVELDLGGTVFVTLGLGFRF